MFQRQHFSSLVAQCLDSTFALKAIYSCVARLLNHEILDEEEQPLPMTTKIHPRHFPKLNKGINLNDFPSIIGFIVNLLLAQN